MLEFLTSVTLTLQRISRDLLSNTAPESVNLIEVPLGSI